MFKHVKHASTSSRTAMSSIHHSVFAKTHITFIRYVENYVDYATKVRIWIRIWNFVESRIITTDMFQIWACLRMMRSCLYKPQLGLLLKKQYTPYHSIWGHTNKQKKQICALKPILFVWIIYLCQLLFRQWGIYKSK